MNPVHIIGHAGSGKTSLIVALVREFISRGLVVGTLKHSAHTHELDKPGKDTFLHRTAGAAPVAMVTANLSAIYLPHGKDTTPENILNTYFTHSDIVLIEGWISGPYRKVEVFREAVGRPPLFHELTNVEAVITDDTLFPEKIPVMRWNNITGIADFLLDLSVRL